MQKIINVGLASFGMSGQLFHAPFIANNPNFNLAAIVERHKNDSRVKYPESKLYRSFSELLTDDSIDLIVVNTPVQTHFDYTKKSLNLGKNVLVEKPFTVSALEAEELYQLSKINNCFLSVYQNRRYDGDFLKVKEIVQSNVLGNLKEVEIRFDRFRTEISGKVHKEMSEGSGALHDLGAHLIDQALQLFGMPKSIFADLGFFREKTQTNDYFELILFYENELRVRLKSSTMAKEKQWEYILHGDKGSFLQQRFDAQENELSKGVEPTKGKWLPEINLPNGILHTLEFRKETIAQNGNYMNFYDDLYESIIYGKPNPVPIEQVIDLMRIIDKSFESFKIGNKVCF
ncbi:Gfo/Idh/MocA family oxidoreductase [Capnocytophaga felis]|uniref:Oxidoreductase n=1 Tax=Capnocytophaga felis TaxID=2267611 RepID=A0A5M4B6Z8_9FLAO|nr:Gfo/Idh/MocA family oxidoreductase [Capnocytophaga felis]GET45130.1 oxidoreductase [Capnocytophaga felis]GET47706.1 oxidoreductase [Capnocytophaga felis]